jgi:hypothetical protein
MIGDCQRPADGLLSLAPLPSFESVTRRDGPATRSLPFRVKGGAATRIRADDFSQC